MAQIQQYVQYYIDCNLSENKLLSIQNLYGNALENKYLIDDLSFISIEGYAHLITDQTFSVWRKQLLLYQKEKQIIGTSLIFKESDKKLIPIFIYPCHLQKNAKEGKVEAEFEDGHVNPYFLEVLKKLSSSEVAQEFKDYLTPLKKWNDELCYWIQSFFEINDIPVMLDSLVHNKGILTTKEIKQTPVNSICQMIFCGISRRSIGVRYLINDFQKLREVVDYSNPITSIFEGKVNASGAKSIELLKGFSLSSAQESILTESPKYNCSVVIGPPGTGKTYTLTSLAVQLVQQGNSVLIASSNDMSVDVAHGILLEKWGAGNYAIRAGRGMYRNKFRKDLSDAQSPSSLTEIKHSLRRLKNAISHLKLEIEELERSLKANLQNENNLADYLIDGSKNFIHKWWSEYRIFLKSRDSFSITNIHSSLHQLKQKLLDKQLALIANRVDLARAKMYNRDPSTVKEFIRMIFTRQPIRRTQIQSALDYRAVLSLFPLWCMKYQDVGKYFPLQKHLFDYVLLDEGTQIDIASALPTLQRCRSVICFGDYQQIRRISFLSSDQEESMAKKRFGDIPNDLLYYRDNSLLYLIEDRSADVEDLFLLDEHYRSCPSIIAFSNEYYYGNSIQLMHPKEIYGGLQFHLVPGHMAQSGVNVVEVDFIIKRVKKCIETGCKSSIGILSPFRKQVDLIKRKCDEEFSIEELEVLRLRVDTPYGFQGDERDVIFISLALDDEAPSGSWNYLNSHGLWNVCVTRAKKEQHLVHSMDPSLIHEDNIIKIYFRYRVSEEVDGEFIPNLFVREVQEYLYELGVQELKVNKLVGGVEADIIFVYRNNQFVVDLVGYPGKFHGYVNDYGQDVLHRINHKLIFVLYSDWLLNRSVVKERIENCLLR